MYKKTNKNLLIHKLKIIESIIYLFPKYLKSIQLNEKNEIHVRLRTFSHEHHFEFFAKFFKKHSNFKCKILADIVGIDLLNSQIRTRSNMQERYFLVYNLLSVLYNTRILIYKKHHEYIYTISLTNIFKSAGWLEREVWDLFGIFFFQNIDLRRILTDYGFEGFPLRKDFPLTGYLEISYNEKKKSIVYKKVEMAQEFRNFKFLTPWASSL